MIQIFWSLTKIAVTVLSRLFIFIIKGYPIWAGDAPKQTTFPAKGHQIRIKITSRNENSETCQVSILLVPQSNVIKTLIPSHPANMNKISARRMAVYNSRVPRTTFSVSTMPDPSSFPTRNLSLITRSSRSKGPNVPHYRRQVFVPPACLAERSRYTILNKEGHCARCYRP